MKESKEMPVYYIGTLKHLKYAMYTVHVNEYQWNWQE